MKNSFARRCFLALAVILISNAASAQERPMGTDVSSFQDIDLDWASLKTDGPNGMFFAWAKCTEGLTYFDANFTTYEANASAAGMLIGAYHYAHPISHPGLAGADSEAQFFWSKASNYVTAGGTYLVPMLDWEDPTASPTNTSQTAMSAWANEWCGDVSNYARAQGVLVRPVIYTGLDYGETWLNSSVTIWPSWIADYKHGTSSAGYGDPSPQTDQPDGWAPWPNWNLWQYGDTNWSGGDSDVFNGTSNQFLSLFLVGSTNAPHITTNLANLTVAQGSNVTLSISVIGGTPLYYHLFFNGATVDAATNFDTNTVGFTINDIQMSNAGPYSVQVSNSFGTNLSATAFLSVVAPLSNNTGSALAPSGLVNWWTADGNTIDIVNGMNGLPAGGFSYVPGKRNEAFHFDGSTGYITNTNAPASLSGSWTVSMWVDRQATAQTSDALLSDGTHILKLEQYKNTHDVGLTQSGVADWVFTNSSNAGYSVPVGIWTHLAVVGAGSGASGTMTLYINGAQEGLINTNVALGRLTIGAAYYSGAGYLDYLAGSVDELMIFNKALTVAQIQNIYSTGAAGLVDAPQFTGISADLNNDLVFSLEGLTGSRNFTIYYSTNLPNWSVLTTTLSAANGSNSFTVSPTNAAAFYRAIQP